MKKPSAQHTRRAAFTLVEMLIVISITLLLSAAAVGYTKTGQNEVSLTIETSKIAELILQAKELAINTYGTTAIAGSKACGYGVHFDVADQTYSLFAYSVAADTACPSLDEVTANGLTDAYYQEYEPGSWDIAVAQGVVMQGSGYAADALGDVLFYPPAPTVLICRASGDSSVESGGNIPNCTQFMSPAQTSKVYLSTVDGVNSAAVSVTPEGEVTF